MLLIDKLSTTPVYEQIIDGIERNILLGIYPCGSLLPSVREQSVTLGINPNTIQKSYAELTRRGIIQPSPGSGCFVSPNAKELLLEAARTRLSSLRELLSELRTAGVERSEVLDVVNTVYPDTTKEEETT